MVDVLTEYQIDKGETLDNSDSRFEFQLYHDILFTQ